MKIRLLCVGKLTNPNLRALALEYQERMKRLCDLEVVEIKDADHKDPSARLEREAERILAEAGSAAECALWDERGEAMDSLEFSRFLERKESSSAKRFTLIIGSSHGLAPSLKDKVAKKIQLGKMTFPHELVRVMALEQLYRAHCIKKNLPYHH